MSEKQWRVVADRDKGDDPQVSDLNNGDRATVIVMNDDPANDLVVRIERPVSTEHCLPTAQHDGHEWAAHKDQPGTGYWCPGFDAAEERPVPTTDEGEPMPVTLPVSPGDLETSADAVRDALRDQPRDIIRSELGTAARRFDMAAQLLRQTFDHQPSLHPPTREQIAEAIEQDERVQTWHTIWAYVCENHPQPIEDERTAEQYVLALIQNGADR